MMRRALEQQHIVAMADPRPDFQRLRRINREMRPLKRLAVHYALEKELAGRLRGAPREHRSMIYAAVYGELFASLPDHPQHRGSFRSEHRVEPQLRLLDGHLDARSTFLEIGCGDGALAIAIADRVAAAYGLDVTADLVNRSAAPGNFTFLHAAGIEVPLPDDTIDFAYSNQLLEHLHADDAADQFREIFRVLKPGGRYMCITPSRITGPHDISCYFDYEAGGLHLKEYDYGALRRLFRDTGFRHVACFASLKGHQFRFPYPAVRAFELALLSLSARVRATLACMPPMRAVMGLTAIGRK
jgi:SAM-dependent methyltransferase